jgi:adenylate cyclase
MIRPCTTLADSSVPEKLHLLYPKSLAGRLEISNDIRANVEVNDPRTSHVGHRSIDIEQVKELSTVILRLEALSAAQPTPVPSMPISPGGPTSPRTPTARPAVIHPAQPVVPPAYLGPCIREDMTDEELTLIIESLATRAENAMSTMVRPPP